jgi:hypothetical protein
MARPRKRMEKHRPRHLGFRTPVWIHDAVHRIAAEQEQPVSDIANELLEMALGSLGIKKPRPEATTEGR